MNLAATWESDETEARTSLEETAPNSPHNITLLRELVLRLLCEVQSINEASPLTMGDDFDFYDEVSRFEIELIKRALLQTGGHQTGCEVAESESNYSQFQDQTLQDQSHTLWECIFACGFEGQRTTTAARLSY